VRSVQLLLNLSPNFGFDCRIDYLINNAGIFVNGWNKDVYDEVMATNFWGVVKLTEACLPHMKVRTVLRILLVSAHSPIRKLDTEESLTYHRIMALLVNYRSIIAICSNCMATTGSLPKIYHMVCITFSSLRAPASFFYQGFHLTRTMRKWRRYKGRHIDCPKPC